MSAAPFETTIEASREHDKADKNRSEQPPYDPPAGNDWR